MKYLYIPINNKVITNYSKHQAKLFDLEGKGYLCVKVKISVDMINGQKTA
jgi:hypothetical protein